MNRSPLRILVIHNRYKIRGGEDSVVEDEICLLRNQGHPVALYERSNNELDDMSVLTAGINALWSRRSQHEVRSIISDFKPDVVHIHNTFPLVSPSVYWTVANYGIPIVQTLHNFRLLCIQAQFLRHNEICEDCLGRSLWRGVSRRCYRDSLLQSLVAANTIELHRLLGTWNNQVTLYIALNRFCRDIFIRGGLPCDRIVTKPNFVDMPDPGKRRRSNRPLYVGRLSREKGVFLLADAARKLPHVTFDVIGDGPERDLLENISNIHLHGELDSASVYEAMRSAPVLLFPSIWYENFPRTIVEAFACRLPVIASNLGAMQEIISHNDTGLLFTPGSSDAMTDCIQIAMNNRESLDSMGLQCRKHYERHFTAKANYDRLLEIYRTACNLISS